MNLKKNTVYRILSLLCSLSILFGEGVWVFYGWELFEHVTDARTASLGRATTAYPFKSSTASLVNPVFSSEPIKNISITHQSRFAGIVNSDLIGFQLERNENPMHLNFLYEGVGQIPDTRSMLLDWGQDGQFGTNDPGEGNGVLDEGERLDKDQLRYFSQHQIGFHGAVIRMVQGLPIGIGFKVLSYSLDDHFALGIGLDLGFKKRIKKTNIGIVLRNMPASGLIWDSGTVEGTVSSIAIGAHHPFMPIKIPSFVLHSMINLNGAVSNRHLDSQLRIGPLSVDGALGLEGIYKDKLSIRMGRNSVNNSTGGLGVKWDGFEIDYAFLTSNVSGEMGNHHLISLILSLDWILSRVSTVQQD